MLYSRRIPSVGEFAAHTSMPEHIRHIFKTLVQRIVMTKEVNLSSLKQLFDPVNLVPENDECVSRAGHEG